MALIGLVTTPPDRLTDLQQQFDALRNAANPGADIASDDFLEAIVEAHQEHQAQQQQLDTLNTLPSLTVLFENNLV